MFFLYLCFFFFSSRRRHTRYWRDWSSDVCSSDLDPTVFVAADDPRPIYTSHTGIDLAGISGTYGRFFLAGARATVDPGASSGERMLEHPGEELIYLLEGELEFVVNSRTYRLRPCDSLHFRTVQPHAWRNPGTRPAVAMWMALRPQ